ncbi:YHS domain-containing (seleno)protein [Glacieibacterium frigidum]|uniref:YHS domain protein n=1 Tax=Glacieibacterium frigidum TaxID=2593303 RepID=A0A552UH31_9SPHN|nr:YHS domain-containing (seleno)protein [Glacieibacterium frigidum]TRW17532.1 YHS domain protein [Glacieibacterium frigidum]
MRLKTLLLAVALAVAPAPGFAKIAPVYTGTFSNVAVSGYDPVAYFTQKKPVKGSPRFSTSWQGAEWHFANAAYLAAFKANPTKYAPQYGGYCAWAVSQGYTASGDPMVWKVVNDRLYLNYNADIGAKWSKNIPGFIAAGDTNWPKLTAK